MITETIDLEPGWKRKRLWDSDDNQVNQHVAWTSRYFVSDTSSRVGWSLWAQGRSVLKVVLNDHKCNGSVVPRILRRWTRAGSAFWPWHVLIDTPKAPKTMKAATSWNIFRRIFRSIGWAFKVGVFRNPSHLPIVSKGVLVDHKSGLLTFGCWGWFDQRCLVENSFWSYWNRDFLYQ